MFARYATKTKLPSEEIEKRLERPRSQQEMRMLYSLAYNQVLYLFEQAVKQSFGRNSRRVKALGDFVTEPLAVASGLKVQLLVPGV